MICNHHSQWNILSSLLFPHECKELLLGLRGARSLRITGTGFGEMECCRGESCWAPSRRYQSTLYLLFFCGRHYCDRSWKRSRDRVDGFNPIMHIILRGALEQWFTAIEQLQAEYTRTLFIVGCRSSHGTSKTNWTLFVIEVSWLIVSRPGVFVGREGSQSSVEHKIKLVPRATGCSFGSGLPFMLPVENSLKIVGSRTTRIDGLTKGTTRWCFNAATERSAMEGTGSSSRLRGRRERLEFSTSVRYLLINGFLACGLTFRCSFLSFQFKLEKRKFRVNTTSVCRRSRMISRK